MKKIILVCGPAGIGKSTYSHNYAANHPEEEVHVIAADECRRELCGGYDKFPEGGNMVPVYELMVTKAKGLAKGKEDITVIFDTTSLTDRRRMFYVKRLKGIFDHFELMMLRLHDYEQCIIRNEKRPRDRYVPPQVIRDMVAHYEEPSEKTMSYFDVVGETYMD